MNLSLRIIRFVILLLAGLAAIFLNQKMNGFSALLAISLSISAALTVIFLFFNFDKQINDKVIMELISDGFAGIVLFTYPQSDERFFLIVFSFWIAWMGILYLTSGLLDKKNEKMMWLFTLIGIILIILGFVILNYSTEMLSSVIYLVGFTLIIYSSLGFYSNLLRKSKNV